jgi:hypothetical protein
MNPEALPTAAPVARRQRRLLIRGICIAAICVLLATIIFVMSLAHPRANGVVWLTAAQRKQLIQPGRLTQLKWKLMNWTAPLLGRLWGTDPGIHVESHLLALPPTAGQLPGLPAPVATNTDGARAWILPSSDLKSFLQAAEHLDAASIVGSPSVQTGNGTSAQVSMTANISVAGKSVPVGLTLDLTPKVVRDSVSLIVGVTSTSASVGPDSNSPPVIHTNLNLICQTWLSNQCSLVVDGGPARDEKGNSYWFVLAPTIVDAVGNARK